MNLRKAIIWYLIFMAGMTCGAIGHSYAIHVGRHPPLDEIWKTQ